MKNHKIAFLLIFFPLSLLLLAACSSPSESSMDSNPNLLSANGSAAAAEASKALYPSPDNNLDSGQDEMVAFRGTVFVATSQMVNGLWQTAGWQISEQPIDTDANEVPSDCTLYPHAGVVGQWVGRCRGKVSVPRKGAEHIAVMVTDENGNVSMIQIAPPSEEGGP